MLKEHVWPTPWPASPDIPQQENAQTNYNRELASRGGALMRRLEKTEPSEVPREIPPAGIGPALQLHEVDPAARAFLSSSLSNLDCISCM